VEQAATGSTHLLDMPRLEAAVAGRLTLTTAQTQSPQWRRLDIGNDEMPDCGPIAITP